MGRLKYPPVYIAVETSLGTVDRIEFATQGRFPSPPRVPGWVYDPADDHWLRADNDANIQAEIDDLNRYFGSLTLKDGSPHPDRRMLGKWVRLTDAQRAVTEQDRAFRRAVVMLDGALQHDVAAARECVRRVLRHRRGQAMPELDAQWMRATGQGDKAAAKRIEAERQRWRDAPADPRIEAAQTLDELRALLPG